MHRRHLALLTSWAALAACASDPPRAVDASPTLALGSVEKDPVATCLACHRDEEPAGPPAGSPYDPVLPRFYSAEWYYYNVREETPPPYASVPATDTRGHGITYYDWDRKAMVEIYEEVCVNRFPGGHQFPCKFLHVGDTAYYMTFARSAHEPPATCCVVLEPPFYPVRPDFVSLSMTYQKRMSMGGRDADWWLLDVHYPSRYFGYGFDRETRDPLAFWYRVLDGWGQQNFYNVRRERPDPAVFAVPESCRAAKPCRTTRAPG